MNLGFLLIAYVSIASTAILGLVVGWKLALVTLVAAFPLVFFSGVFRVRIEMQFEKATAEVFAESSKFAAEAVASYRTVTSLTLEDKIEDRYRILLADHVASAWKKTRFTMILFSLSESVMLLAMALSFWYGGRLISWHEYTVEQFFIVYIAIVQGAEASGQFFAFTPSMLFPFLPVPRIYITSRTNYPRRHGPSRRRRPPHPLPS